MADYSLPVDQAGRVTTPTIVTTGGESFPFMRETAQALANALPEGRAHIIEGQDHNIAPEAMAPGLREFFGS
jgi:hypothetical protein